MHFEFAQGLSPFKSGTDELNSDYFNQVYHQALSLFHDIFSADDKILFVSNIYQNRNHAKRSKKKVKIYNHYIKNKNVLFRLKQETLPYMFDDEDDAESYCTCQFSLECRKQDIRDPLLKAICNQDFQSLKPRFNDLNYPDEFFINVTKGVIFFIYDDRGCEVIANDIETIRPLYEKYTNWVDEYYREEINQRFK
ncbi:DUF3885 domain-containing protein [Bacillus capparidis]|uniref:DUF3885 domain-containing protein n=1 Tax=Bacillus capparidis TaxID=1840411 RepID=UPI00406BB13C